MKGGAHLIETNSILKDIRKSVGLGEDVTDFDTELLRHINNNIGKVNQAGVGNFIVVQDENQTWAELKDPLQEEGNHYFAMIPLFISLSTKLLFDPPPPSSVEFHSRTVDETLWRLKVAYDYPYSMLGGEN